MHVVLHGSLAMLFTVLATSIVDITTSISLCLIQKLEQISQILFCQYVGAVNPPKIVPTFPSIRYIINVQQVVALNR